MSDTTPGIDRDSDPRPQGRVLNVLHVTNIETANYYLNNLIDYTEGNEIKYFAATFGARGGFVEDLERRGVRAFALNCLSRRRYPRAARKLLKIITGERIDIVHTHLFDPTVVGLLMARLRKRGLIITRHHSDAIYAMPHGLKRAVYLFLEKRIYANADHIIAPSKMVRDLLVEREAVPPSKISLIPYGQRTERFDAITDDKIARVREELGMKDGLALVNVSRLYHRKGHRYLFEALARLRREGLDANLYLVGEGPEESELKALARQLGLDDKIRFLGWRDDALAIIAAADIVVHPSLEDALSSAVIEALMLERPLVATDISGVRDSVGDNEYGVIVPPADAEALRLGLLHTINHLEEARMRARRGRQFILKYMEPGRVAQQYVDCYRRVAMRDVAGAIADAEI